MAFFVIFTALGILNLIFVHPVPAVFYGLLALVYLPAVNAALKRLIGFAIPLYAKVILGLLVLWATLAVGELAELAGF